MTPLERGRRGLRQRIARQAAPVESHWYDTIVGVAVWVLIPLVSYALLAYVISR